MSAIKRCTFAALALATAATASDTAVHTGVPTDAQLPSDAQLHSGAQQPPPTSVHSFLRKPRTAEAVVLGQAELYSPATTADAKSSAPTKNTFLFTPVEVAAMQSVLRKRAAVQGKQVLMYTPVELGVVQGLLRKRAEALTAQALKQAIAEEIDPERFQIGQAVMDEVYGHVRSRL